MNEDCASVTRKYEIRSARKIFTMETVPMPTLKQRFSKDEFWAGVSRPDLRHVVAALLWRQNVHRALPTYASPLKNVSNDFGELICQERRNRVANLPVLICPCPFEKVVIREGLYARGFPYCPAAALGRIMMNK